MLLRRAPFDACALLLACTVLLACASAPVAPDIRGTSWELVELEGRTVTLPAASQPYISFSEAGGTVQGMPGCNVMGGSYTREGESLVFGPLNLTRRACEPALMQVENRFVEVLAAVSRFSMADGMMLLWAGDRQVATLRPRAPTPGR